ncbi:MAG: lysophospholipid acyltransferase family protein [Microthrixaceae bacterium]
MSSNTEDSGEPKQSRAGVGTTLLSIWSWFVFGACVALWMPMMAIVWLVTLPFDRARWWTGYLYRKLPVVHQKLNPLWHFKVSGVLPENPRNPYVVVSNHESFVDILLISHLPWEMKWLSKKEMFKIPFAGWLMRLSADIPLERGDRESAGKAMDLCKVALDRKVSVMIFPEGTRSATGEMRDFKDGAFRLAIETQLPILPLVVSGTRNALRKHDWRFGRADAEVRVMPPVPTEGLTLEDVDALRDEVRSLIETERDIMRAA